MGSYLEISKPVPSDTPPLARPHLLIPPKQFHLLQINYSNMGPVLTQTSTPGYKDKAYQ